MASNIELEELCPPIKKSRSGCIIHCTDDDSKLIQPQNYDSWLTLLKAAEIKGHEALLQTAKNLHEFEVPKDIQYHRRCRSVFTMKKQLDAIVNKRSNEDDSESITLRQSKRETSSASRVLYGKECIFCEKSSKYIKGTRTRERLIQCQELRADVRIREAATKKLDKRILALLSRDLVAAEGHYHLACYKNYTCVDVKTECKSTVGDEACSSQDSYDLAVNKAFEKLFIYIRNEVIQKPKVVSQVSLTSELEQFMRTQGIESLKRTTKNHVRRRLETEFGEALRFVSDANGRVIVYPDCLSTDVLAQQVYSLQNELEKAQSGSAAASITRAATELRDTIKKTDQKQTWPPDTTKNVVPESVEQFLCTLITGEQKGECASEKVQRVVSSIGSDLVFSVTAGRIKPPKHVLLPFAIKSLTGNIELIQILNRLGHSISRHQYEEINTALSIQKLELIENQSTFLPNAHPNVPTTVAWDNIDRLEETLSGGGTSHRVNGIAIQPCVEGPSLQTTAQSSKSKRRSIKVSAPELPVFNAGERCGPPKTVTSKIHSTKEIQQAQLKNLIWVLARLYSEERGSISSWTGFNIEVRDKMLVMQDTITYLPTINAPATQLSTVNEVLEQTLRIMEALNLKEIVCVFDQAFFAKAAEIVWKDDRFRSIVIRMGTFHTICNLLGIIGKRFQHAGLGDLCVEAGIVAEGSLTGVMEGRRYNRAVRAHKLVYEALMRLAWKGFRFWLQEHHSDEMECLVDMKSKVEQLQENVCQDKFESLLEEDCCEAVLHNFEMYKESIRESNSLSTFWLSYLEMVEILLDLVRASREGNWLLHLGAIERMIPWCFAYDKVNYARYLPFYYGTMSNLESEHPEVYKYFMEGGFSVQIGQKNPFGRIPVDQATEETVNRDTQTAGGTKGFSLKSDAVAKYHLTAEFRSKYLRDIRDMVSHNESEVAHKDLQSTRIKKDESDVDKIQQMLETSLLNPFSPDNQELVSLTTAVAAPDDVTRDLLEANSIGKEAYKVMKEQRLDLATGFFDKMPKRKLKTFSDIGKKPRVDSKTKDIVLKADRKLFGQMVLVAESRELRMEDVLAHPLGPLPWALANSDGSLRKSNKAVLARELEKCVSPAENIPRPSAYVIDGMALLQKCQGNDKTFAELADSVLKKVMHEGALSQRIDVVFDVYRTMSIKNVERERRGSETGFQFKNIAPGHTIKQWRRLLSNAENKTNLIRFLVGEWRTPQRREMLNDKVLYVTCDQSCLKLSKESCEEIPGLASSHEEADTRLLLHAKHAADTGSKSIVISADDTDVTVISIGLSNCISQPMYQKSGTKNRTKYTDIGKLNSALGQSVSDSLIGMHAFSGCDTVSAFNGRGKISILKQTKANTEFQQAFKELGREWKLSDALFARLQHITCKMYLASSKTKDVNKLRYQLFCAKRGDLESSQLPPCKDSLYMHAQRANYQACIWRRSLDANAAIPHPQDHGWTIEDGELGIKWMQGSPAPDAVIDLLRCDCVRACKPTSCTCLNNGLKCTDMCKLQTCANQVPVQHVTENQDLESESDDDDQ